LGVFAFPALAMEAPRVQEVRDVLKSKPGLGTWEEKTSGGEDFYFSVEGWRVLDEQSC
jgi:hypothetical protein